MTMRETTYRPGDLGPDDDPDEAGLDAIEEDEDFQAEFVAEHAWEIIGLICTPERLITEITRKTSLLREQFLRAAADELEARRDV